MSSVKTKKEQSDKSLERLEALISRTFVGSNMSNSKWIKLLKAISDFSEESYPISYKLVNSEQIFQTSTESYSVQVDRYFFVEPILYKEVEWIEFNSEQIPNLSQLISHVEELGRFPIERIENGYRLKSYQ